jgi:hypothetical protein
MAEVGGWEKISSWEKDFNLHEKYEWVVEGWKV